VPGSGAGGRGNPPVLKRFGQHFLVDDKVLQDIADAIAPERADTVLEIGAGRGALTDLLAERAGRVVALEIDRALAARLTEKYAGGTNVEIMQQDVLKADFESLAGTSFLLVGNVPYYITTPIIFKSLEHPMPRRAVFLVQREVADRIASSAGDEDYGALTVNIAATSNTELIRTVPAESFQPPPRVESAVIRLTPRADPLLPRGDLPAFRAFVQAAFGQRRKQIQRVLRSVAGLPATEVEALLESCGVDRTARPETLTPETFVALFRGVVQRGPG